MPQAIAAVVQAVYFAATGTALAAGTAALIGTVPAIGTGLQLRKKVAP